MDRSDAARLMLQVVALCKCGDTVARPPRHLAAFAAKFDLRLGREGRRKKQLVAPWLGRKLGGLMAVRDFLVLFKVLKHRPLEDLLQARPNGWAVDTGNRLFICKLKNKWKRQQPN
jgi:hypothetical protein